MKNFNYSNIVKMSFGYIKKLELVKNGDAGVDCKVYHLNNKECIKLFNHSKDIFELKRYHEYTELDFSCAALPKKLYLINNKFRAIKTEYVNGDMLSEINPDMEYSKYLSLSKILLEASKEISEEGIVVYDAHSNNIMYNYDKDKFVIVDQGEWSSNRIHSEEAKCLNFRILNNTLRSELFDSPFSIGMLKKSLDMYDDYIDFYETEIELVEKKIGKKIITIDEFRKAIR